MTIAQLAHDVALYVYCEACGDIVEAGELSCPLEGTQVIAPDKDEIQEDDNVSDG